MSCDQIALSAAGQKSRGNPASYHRSLRSYMLLRSAWIPCTAAGQSAAGTSLTKATCEVAHRDRQDGEGTQTPRLGRRGLLLPPVLSVGVVGDEAASSPATLFSFQICAEQPPHTPYHIQISQALSALIKVNTELVESLNFARILCFYFASKSIFAVFIQVKWYAQALKKKLLFI